MTVYFICSVGDPTMVKIGVTDNLDARMAYRERNSREAGRMSRIARRRMTWAAWIFPEVE